MPVNHVEEAFVRTFVLKAKRERVLALLSSKKKRSEYLNRLNHTPDLDVRFMKELSADAANAVQLLKQKGAPDTCYLISDEPDLDGQSLPLQNAIEKAFMASWGTIICCIPGRLAYYVSEAPGSHYLLERRA